MQSRSSITYFQLSRTLCLPPTAGLLSTEAGTLGRFAGNALLALAGRLTGLADSSQLASFCAILYATLAATCATLLAHLLCIYGRLKG